MTEHYREQRQKQERRASVIGIILALGTHALLIVFALFNGLKYLYPPPPEPENLLIEFEYEEEKVRPQQRRDGTRPQAEIPSDEVELVQRSQADLEGSKANEAKEATLGEEGDVEVPEPPRKEINTRALFKAADNKSEKDTLAPQTAAKPDDALKAGHAMGNTLTGRTSGTPKAEVKGRNTVGVIPKPDYKVQEDGIVVVDIVVDRTGKVVSAVPGGMGTTASDPALWTVAKNAALKTYFNVDMNAPERQSGTITYRFELKN